MDNNYNQLQVLQPAKAPRNAQAGVMAPGTGSWELSTALPVASRALGFRHMSVEADTVLNRELFGTRDYLNVTVAVS